MTNPDFVHTSAVKKSVAVSCASESFWVLWLRCPLSLSRIHWTPGAKTLFYEAKGSQDDPLASHPQGESLDVFEFLARVLTQIPKPRQHSVHYMGAYSSRARAFRKRKNLPLQSLPSQQEPKSKPEPKLSPKKRTALRKRWAQLIKRVHQTDPLHCDCGGTYRLVAFFTEHKGPGKNNFPFWGADPSPLAALLVGHISRYYSLLAPCQAGASTPENGKLFLPRP